MHEIRAPEILVDAECWRLLAAADVGRIAVAVAGEPEIFPINFVVDANSLVFKTAEGTKLAAIAVSSRVALEVDGYDAERGEAWSVVAKGTATEVKHYLDVYAADRLPLFPWHAGYKGTFVRIVDTVVTGRRFTAVGHGPTG